MSTDRVALDCAGIAALPQRFRARMVNSLSGFKSANLVGTADASGRAACCIVSSVVHLGSDPAMLGVVFRPPGDDAHNYCNLTEAGCFTLSHVALPFFEAAHQTSARYPEDISEFEAAGLTPFWHIQDGHRFPAPAVEESPVRIGLKVMEDLCLPNRCRFVIGAIQWVNFTAELQADDGFLDLAAAKTIAIGGLDAYHTAQRVARLSYAKPDCGLVSRSDFLEGWD
ncbi:MAG: flavin oxidoreductase [Crocinitomicaceae bacterium]|nr:flavin oxidoreductase [Crocinitomicaceae bacterium]